MILEQDQQIMAGNIRTELAVKSPDDCPVAQASEETGKQINHVTRSSGTKADGLLTEEFTIATDATLDCQGVESVFNLGSREVYRFERRQNQGCVCDLIETYGCPVSNIRATDGTLVVSFYSPDIETIQEIVTELHQLCDDIKVRQLNRVNNLDDHDFVFVDRNRLTARQREVLETSYEMGYFDHPKRANAGEVAEALGISPSTYSEHLAAAQRKLFETILRAS